MANLCIKEVSPEQGIVEYGYHNIKQFDLTAYYGEHIVASLWQDSEANWHWTKRLYDLGNVEDLDIAYLDDKSLKGIIEDFVVRVSDWLEDEAKYLLDIRNGLEDENLMIEV